MPCTEDDCTMLYVSAEARIKESCIGNIARNLQNKSWKAKLLAWLGKTK